MIDPLVDGRIIHYDRSIGRWEEDEIIRLIYVNGLR